MRVYLDSSVFQILKKDNFIDLKRKIDEDREHNIYCFSEAHIFDLLRDKTDNKLSDLNFIEKFVDNNFWYYNKKILFEYITPLEYYNSIDPNSDFSLESVFNCDPLLIPIKSIFESIPIKLSDYFSSSDISNQIPENLKRVFCEPTNLYELMVQLLDFSGEITKEQKSFKELLSKLRNEKLIDDVYKYFGIKGFENGKLINKEDFRDSLVNHLLKNKKETYRYDLFLEIYNTLEIYGFVKGKLKKQALPNMIDDGRHAFFGSFCDVVVSLDSDFINKTKFIYNLFDYDINVLNIQEFDEWLGKSKKNIELGIKYLFDEINRDYNNLQEVYKEKRNNQFYSLYYLSHTYLNYFNSIGLVFSDKLDFFFYTKDHNNQSTGTLTKEIEYVTNRLINELGTDLENKGEFCADEFVGEEWKGRCWLINNIQVNLNINQKIVLSVIVNESNNEPLNSD